MAISRVLLILIFSVAQLAAGGSAFGLVFCIGEDGHAGIELTHEVCDEQVQRQAYSDVDRACVELAALGSSCDDVSLSTGAVSVAGRSQDRGLTLSLLYPVLLAGFAVPPVLDHQGSAASRSSFHDTGSSLSLLRTVVLTI